jgi:large subunit ribosomal protein L21
MDANKLRIADPTTWPKQASLLADGKLDELKKYQDSLKGGRE